MSDIEQSRDASKRQPGLSRPDFFTRVAGSHLSRRDMVKASVVAGGLVWSAPMLLSADKAAAQATCCPTNPPHTTVTVTISPGGVIGCGTLTCLGTGTACDADIIPCINEFVDVAAISISIATGLPLVGTVSVNAVGIRLQGGASLAAVAAQTTGGGLLSPGGCTTIGNCPSLSVAKTAGPLVIQADGLIAVVNASLLFGTLNHIELELCVPGTASGLCP